MSEDNTTETQWRIVLDASDAEALAALAENRIWNCFAIADLTPPLRTFTQVALAHAVEGTERATCLLVRHPALMVLAPEGAATAVAALLARLTLPERVLVQAEAGHLLTLARYYRLARPLREMLRMAAAAETFQPEPSSESAARRLTTADLDAMRELYALYPESHFRADAVEHAVFYGLWEGERLLAAGGTHAVAPPHGIAVIGNVFTRPEARERGYARAVTSALVADLLGRGCRDVALNVTANNDPAINLYTSLGFETHARYWTGEAERITHAPPPARQP